MSNDEQPIPEGWPPGYTCKRLSSGRGTYCCISRSGLRIQPKAIIIEADKARIAAHEHYRTTREYRLEQRNAELERENASLRARLRALVRPAAMRGWGSSEEEQL